MTPLIITQWWPFPNFKLFVHHHLSHPKSSFITLGIYEIAQGGLTAIQRNFVRACLKYMVQKIHIIIIQA